MGVRQQHAGDLVLPMHHRGELRSLALLPAKPNGEQYRPDEIDVPGIATNQVGLDLYALLIALNIMCATPSVSNDETKTSLEKAPFLPVPADIFRHDLSWISPASCTAPCDQAHPGTIRPGEEEEKTHPVIE
jgi:hypothetical protein